MNRSGHEQEFAVRPARTARSVILGHLEIARLDHWTKNVFVLPGTVAALALDPAASLGASWGAILLALLSTGLVASSNYTLNEVLDGDTDRMHPVKKNRAVPGGRVSIPLAYAQWVLLAAAGLLLGMQISPAFFGCMAAFWFMGCVYNVRPIRTKDLPHLDVLSEAVNNPIRMLAGWYAVSSVLIPPISLLVCYWMVGAYFMTIKRLAEVRALGDPATAAAYRRSFAAVTERSLLVFTMFYGSMGMLFFGAFLMRYRIEMILSFPLIAVVMAAYLNMAFDNDSPAQYPERLHRHPQILAAVTLCAVAMTMLFFVDIPLLHQVFAPTIPEATQVPPSM